jgi:hypothetical protein
MKTFAPISQVVYPTAFVELVRQKSLYPVQRVFTRNITQVQRNTTYLSHSPLCTSLRCTCPYSTSLSALILALLDGMAHAADHVQCSKRILRLSQ